MIGQGDEEKLRQEQRLKELEAEHAEGKKVPKYISEITSLTDLLQRFQFDEPVNAVNAGIQFLSKALQFLDKTEPEAVQDCLTMLSEMGDQYELPYRVTFDTTMRLYKIEATFGKKAQWSCPNDVTLQFLMAKLDHLFYQYARERLSTFVANMAHLLVVHEVLPQEVEARLDFSYGPGEEDEEDEG